MIGYQLLNLIITLMHFYSYVLIARILMSWVPDIQRTRFGQILVRLTEPYLGLFRRFIPMIPLGGSYLDISSIVAIIAWSFVEQGIASVLAYLFLR
ncbi:MAG: YggT family protein [Tumebacillaceae bacterium]